MPLAKEAAAAGLRVVGVDVDPRKVEALNAGQSYIDDLTDADLEHMLANGFSATLDESVLARSNTDRHLRADPAGRGPPARTCPPSRARPGPSRATCSPGTLVVLESTT